MSDTMSGQEGKDCAEAPEKEGNILTLTPIDKKLGLPIFCLRPEGAYSIGRDSDVDFTIPDNWMMISEHHATFSNEDGTWTFRDQSEKGSRLGGKVIRNSIEEIENGHILALGLDGIKNLENGWVVENFMNLKEGEDGYSHYEFTCNISPENEASLRKRLRKMYVKLEELRWELKMRDRPYEIVVGENDQYKYELGELKIRMHDLHEERDKTEFALNEAEFELQKVKVENAGLKTEMVMGNTPLERMIGENKEYENQLRETNIRIKTLIEERTKTQDALNKALFELQEVKVENAGLKTHNQSMADYNQILHDEMKDVQTKRDKLKDKVKRLQTENADLGGSSRKKQRVFAPNEEGSSSKEELSFSQVSKLPYTSCVAASEIEHDFMKVELERLRNSEAGLQTENKNIKEKLDSTKQEVERLRGIVAELNRNYLEPKNCRIPNPDLNPDEGRSLNFDDP